MKRSIWHLLPSINLVSVLFLMFDVLACIFSLYIRLYIEFVISYLEKKMKYY